MSKEQVHQHRKRRDRMFCRVWSMAIHGVEAVPVRVEADVSDGMPFFTIVGSVSTQVKEAQDRVRTALRNLGIVLPPKRIVINLAPADIRKDGNGFDLPIAAAVLQAVGRIRPGSLEHTMMLGELGLNGDVRGVNGVLPCVMRAREMGIKTCIVPLDNLLEGQQAGMEETEGVSSLRELLAVMSEGSVGRKKKEKQPLGIVEKKQEEEELNVGEGDFADILGQESTKRAALIAACGFHNLLLTGPPGSGKSMTAKRLPGIMPPMSREEQLEVTRLYSVAGLLPAGEPLIRRRPFRSPHYSVTAQALVGGGRKPVPGEITLAHRGVLFLDELPEMPRRVLELLRQPLEERKILIARQEGSCWFPASFLLTAAMNPCPCGYYPNRERCTCSDTEIFRYLSKISQAFLDRLDLCAEVPAVDYETLNQRTREKTQDIMSSAAMRKIVMRVREIQEERFEGTKIRFNGEMSPEQIALYCSMTAEASRMLEQAYHTLGLSARGYHRVLRTARTIADIDNSKTLDTAHVGEALCFRSLDKKIWRV